MAQVHKVSRAEVIQAFLDLFAEPRYLEIGVSRGNTFLNVTAARKVAVDPWFKFDTGSVTDVSATFHQVTSDEYFGEVMPQDAIFDVVYLDGLHTFDQTLRDFLNAVECTYRDSIIVIDDTVPSSYHSSLKSLAQARALKDAQGLSDGSWMGDVYRIVPFIESFAQQFSYATVSDNHGQTVVWRHRRAKVEEQDVEGIARAPFETVFLSSVHQKRMSLAQIRETILGDRGARRT